MATINDDTPGHCAADVLSGVPAVMRYIRQEMRAQRRSRLSVPQFRALIFATVHKNSSLSDMADHLGLSLPAASRMADLLVRRGLLERRPGTGDRRRVSLSATRRGKADFQRARHATQSALAKKLAGITAAERSAIAAAMRVLGRVFAPAPLLPLRRKATLRRPSAEY